MKILMGIPMILIKSEKQIEGIKNSSKIAAKCLKFIAPYVKEGVTTKELDLLIGDYIIANGAKSASKGYMGYPFATCISVNEVVCHGVPSDYKLKKGDIVNVDVATIHNGYYGDNSTMFSVGDISEDAKKVMLVAKNCLDLGIKFCLPGSYFSSIGYAIGKYAHSQGCGVVDKFCGHGVGLYYHEEPQICHINEHKNAGPVMQPGMIFTVEPMINLGSSEVVICENDGWTARTVDGQLSAQYEHTILITKDGCEILTQI